jgi:hypothetical protein
VTQATSKGSNNGSNKGSNKGSSGPKHEGPEPLPAGWLPPAFNQGWTYRDRPGPGLESGTSVAAYYASRYGHSDHQVWRHRLAAGEVEWNGQRLRADAALAAGDRLAWHRPPWQEAAVPDLPGPLFDDGDLLVIDKPSGLPVLPAGGWLEHTVMLLLERRHRGDPAGLPRPVHRLGRFTSGLLVCARRPRPGPGSAPACATARPGIPTRVSLGAKAAASFTGPWWCLGCWPWHRATPG